MYSFKPISHFIIWMAGLSILACGSSQSIININNAAGMNGGFEFFCQDLACNWYFFAPQDLEAETYAVLPDRENVKEGNQSLHFSITAVGDELPNWTKPGLFQTFKGKEGEIYNVQFWIKNEGASIQFKIGSEQPNALHTENILTVEKDIQEWQLISYQYKIPPGFETIRFELNILKPGDFWIDGLKIEGKHDSGERIRW